MAGVCFFYEDTDVDVFSGRQVLLDAWNYALKTPGDIDKVIIINKTDQEITFNNEFSVTILRSATDFNPTGVVAYIGAANEFIKPRPLKDFSHNVNWYFFGPAAGHDKKKSGIYIPSASDMVYHSVHAATVVMADRYSRLN